MSQFPSSELAGFASRREREEQLVREERFFQPDNPWGDVSRGGLAPADAEDQSRNVGDWERILSVAAGAGLATVGLMRGRWDGLLLAALGAGFVWRGYSGRCQCYAALGINTAEHHRATAVPAQQGVKVEKSIRIRRPPHEIYQFWRRLENLPRVMKHLERVEPLDSQRSHWVAVGPLGTHVEWDAEILNERENELIAWRSMPGGDIQTAGSIRFEPAHDGSTDLTLSMKYNPPAGKAGAQIAHWLGQGLEQKLDEDLGRWKQVMESGAEQQLGGQPFTSSASATKPVR
jgi:uncharacterized membrane protein